MPKQRSSALFVPYEIRPSKQLERRIFLDVLIRAMRHGFEGSTSTYVGNGGTKFYDFIMMHRYLGINKLISVEADESIWPRCHYNKPLETIGIFEGEKSDFFGRFSSSSPHVVWYDSDGLFDKDLVAEIMTIGSKLPEDSFFFFTASAEPHTAIRKAVPKARGHWFREQFDTFASDIEHDQLSDRHYRFAISKVMLRTVRFAFNARPGLIFNPIVKLIYKDSLWMMSIGGVLSGKLRSDKLADDVRDSMPFLYDHADDLFYQIPQFNISEQERLLLESV